MHVLENEKDPYRVIGVDHNDFHIEIPVTVNQSYYEFSEKYFPDSKELVELINSMGYETIDSLPDNVSQLFYFNVANDQVYYFLYRLKYYRNIMSRFTDNELLEIILKERYEEGLDTSSKFMMKRFLMILYNQFGERFIDMNSKDITLSLMRNKNVVFEEEIAKHIDNI